MKRLLGLGGLGGGTGGGETGGDLFEGERGKKIKASQSEVVNGRWEKKRGKEREERVCTLNVS
jgi:hypothetical protein